MCGVRVVIESGCEEGPWPWARPPAEDGSKKRSKMLTLSPHVGTCGLTAARVVLGPSRSLRTSGRSTSRKRGDGRVTAPTAAGGSMASRHRRHGLPSSRTRPRASPGSRHPQPRDQSLHSSNKRRYSKYAVRSTHRHALLAAFIICMSMLTANLGARTPRHPHHASPPPPPARPMRLPPRHRVAHTEELGEDKLCMPDLHADFAL